MRAVRQKKGEWAQSVRPWRIGHGHWAPGVGVIAQTRSAKRLAGITNQSQAVACELLSVRARRLPRADTERQKAETLARRSIMTAQMAQKA